MAILRIPLSQAQEQLKERVRLGRELLERATHWVCSLSTSVPSREEAIWQEAIEWDDYNSTWLLENLGNEVCAEYQAVTGHAYGPAVKRYGEIVLLKLILPLEISKLESILGRLPLWAPTLYRGILESAQTTGERTTIAGRVFISYSREDAAEVDRLQQVLEEAGISVWRDTADLRPGEDWHEAIRQTIMKHSLAFLACFSKKSVSRNASYQNEELILAIEQIRIRRPGQRWFIPIRFDDCDIPDRDLGGGRSLRSIQCADLFGDHLSDATARLVSDIQILKSNG